MQSAPPRGVSCHMNAYGREGLSETTCALLPPLRPACDSGGQQQLARVCLPQHTGRTWGPSRCPWLQAAAAGQRGQAGDPQRAPRQGRSPPSRQGPGITPGSHSTSPAACPKRRCEGGDEPLNPSKRPAQGAVPQAPPRAAQSGAQGGIAGPTPGRRQAEPKALGPAGGASLSLRVQPAAAVQGDSPQGCAQG